MQTIAALLLVLVSSLLRGYVFSLLWRWFIAEPLHVPHITTATAITLAFVMLSGGYATRIDSPDENKVRLWVRAVSTGVIAPWLVLLVGAIIHNLSTP